MITCPQCGGLNGKTRETCADCGASLNNPQGVKRRAMCGQCSAIYTTTARYCPKCGGLLRKFDGSVEVARAIAAQREEDAVRPATWKIVLALFIPGLAIDMARVAYFNGDTARGLNYLLYSFLNFVLLILLVVLLTLLF